MLEKPTTEEEGSKEFRYPLELLDWAGHREGGVRRLFDEGSGRPCQSVFQTNLLVRLTDWATRLASGDLDVPRVVLLVGGPGNGKTEAVEATFLHLDKALGCAGRLVASLKVAFHPPEDQPVSRLVTIDAGALAHPSRQLQIKVVQDASAGGNQSASLTVDELTDALDAPLGTAYLCCVNRGVLDDAMIHAIDSELFEVQGLLEAVVTSVSMLPEAPSCWPLEGFSQVAVWPMDAESLLEDTEVGGKAPAVEILERALDPSRWMEAGSCAAGQACPFCGSRKTLAGSRESQSLVKMLRWFELGTGKRWAFRDLFSLLSYMLAGGGSDRRAGLSDPCSWAAAQDKADQSRALAKPRQDTSAALFRLVAAQYQHALFHRWDRGISASLERDIKDLDLQTDHTAMGLYYFLQPRNASRVPTTIAALLDSFVDLLDPAMAPPNTKVTLWGGEVSLGDLDIRFSRSVREGLDFAKKYRELSQAERLLLERLATLDEHLGDQRHRRKRPTAATRIQCILRDFACRLTRRSIGVRHASVPEAEALEAFRRVVADAEGQGLELKEIALHIERLLNNDRNFEVSLTSTFGQPLPPLRRRATLVVPGLRVYDRPCITTGRPRPTLCFLEVDRQPIALTYDLFKAVRDLEKGLSPASLPGSVIAMLDTIRARIAGAIVRERGVQERPTIIIGEAVVIERRRGRFDATKLGARR